MKEHLEPDDIPQSEADRLLDLYLATLPRFDPQAGFADRVVARLARGAPPAVAAPRVPALLRRPAVGWSLAGSAAFSSAVLTTWAATNLETMWAVVTAVTMDAGTTGWQAVLGLLAVWSAWAGTTVATAAAAVGTEPLVAATAAAVLAMPVSVLGLLLAVRPALTKTRIHAAR